VGQLKPVPLLPALAALALLAPTVQAAKKPAFPVARVSVVAGDVQHAVRGGDSWSRVKDAADLRVGDRVRTGDDGLARFAFPWMAMTASPGTVVALPAAAVLTMVLEEGRAEQQSLRGAFVKLDTAEAHVRGVGSLAVTRQAGRTVVMVRQGEARVETRKGGVTLSAGQGTVVMAGSAPEPPSPLPEGPTLDAPLKDALYVVLDEPIALSWTPPAATSVLELRALDSDTVVMQRIATGGTASVRIPWPGTYRWRVYSRDARGLESLPSADALVCAVEH
jgi:hypothetical protein